MRRIITKHNPSLVRAQLFYSSLIARVATPKKIPLFFSIHTNMSRDAYTKNRLALVMEKLTYHKTHHLIGVSNDALEDFNKYVGIKGPNYTLYNFINSLYFDKARVFSSAGHMNLKMVAVGNLKPVKNYGYLIHAFEQLKESGITLDIYGDGPLRSTLQDAITKSGVPITLKGSNEEIYNVLPAYDLYVMPSLYEGFGIAPVEAMAIGLPLLLSDIPVLREVVHGNALFFNPNRPESFVSLIHRIIEGAFDLAALSATGIRIATGNYQKKDYITKLNAIYGQALHSSNTPRAK